MNTSHPEELSDAEQRMRDSLTAYLEHLQQKFGDEAVVVLVESLVTAFEDTASRLRQGSQR